MDYPFYTRTMFRLHKDVVAEVLAVLDEQQVVEHPHFQDRTRNTNAFRQQSPGVNVAVRRIAEYLEPVLPIRALYWTEVNQLAPGGKLGEHSDLAHAGYNRQQGTPLEIVLTHKVHVHLKGTSVLRFRRSIHEAQVEVRPEPGDCLWYNNYVLHESENPGEENRIAASLIYWDRDWSIKAALMERGGFKFQRSYQAS